jgi:hypothetical protein
MKIREVVLSQAATHSQQVVANEIARLQDQKVRVYTTTVYPPSPSDDVMPSIKRDRFVTTSKDIHLRIGQMSEEGRWHLAKLIRTEHDRCEHGEAGVLVYEDEEKDRALYATVSLQEIHLTLAN